jgi:hypothetical protein
VSNPNWEDRDPALEHKLRVGRKLKRTIYIQAGPEPSDEDEFIGIMDTEELAAQIVDSHNERRDRVGIRPARRQHGWPS